MLSVALHRDGYPSTLAGSHTCERRCLRAGTSAGTVAMKDTNASAHVGSMTVVIPRIDDIGTTGDILSLLDRTQAAV